MEDMNKKDAAEKKELVCSFKDLPNGSVFRILREVGDTPRTFSKWTASALGLEIGMQERGLI